MLRSLLIAIALCAAPLLYAGPAERLAEAVRIKTVSSQNPAEVDYAAFEALNAYLKDTYPRVFAELDARAAASLEAQARLEAEPQQAFERFLADMWKLSSMFADAALTELRGSVKRILEEPGARSLFGTPLRLTLFFGIQSIGYGSAAAIIVRNTVRRMLRPS